MNCRIRIRKAPKDPRKKDRLKVQGTSGLSKVRRRISQGSLSRDADVLETCSNSKGHVDVEAGFCA